MLWYTGDLSFGYASFYLLVGGVGIGWLAVIFGAFDLMSITENNEAIYKKAIIHGGINSAVNIAYTIILYRLYLAYPILPGGDFGLLMVKVLLVIMLIVGNFIGGSLVLKDKVGIEPIK